MSHDIYDISNRHGQGPHFRGGGATVYVKGGHYTERQLTALVRAVHAANCPPPKVVERWRNPPAREDLVRNEENRPSEPGRPLEETPRVIQPAHCQGRFLGLRAAIERIREETQRRLYSHDYQESHPETGTRCPGEGR